MNNQLIVHNKYWGIQLIVKEQNTNEYFYLENVLKALLHQMIMKWKEQSFGKS